MDKRKLALVAGSLFLSLLCTQSSPATANDDQVPSFIKITAPTLHLNPRSNQKTDYRHRSPDGMKLLYDDICMVGGSLRLVFYQNNVPQLVLKYSPAPAATLPTGKKAEVECPTTAALANQIAIDSSGQYHFTEDGTLMSLSAPDFFLTPTSSKVTSSLSDRIYNTPDGKLKSEEQWNARHVLTGYGHRLDDGGYERTAYFDDLSIASHQVTDKAGLITREEINAAGGLPLSSTVSDKEKIETQKFDPEHHMLWYHDIRFPDGKQSTRELFYMGTDKLRVRAKYDGSKTIADFFRQSDGTLERTQTVDAYDTTVRYMDVTGAIPLYEQVWKFNNTGKGGATDYVMSSMSELNAKGEEVKRFDVSDDHKYISQEARRNITVGTMTYPTVFYRYRDDGTLGEVQYVTPGSLPNPPPEPHKPSEGIKLVVDVEHLKHVKFEDLPVPQQINYDMGGGH